MLLRDLAGAEFQGQVDRAGAAAGTIEISGLSADSRKVEKGTLFVALSGTKADGAAYVADAVARGAVAIVAGHAVDASVPVVIVEN
ncbi:MAG: Mur ligase domain-containing protein, partial [Rhizobium sp.]|nr:Mur ligase domain-containing protein [Rhizobium sp.]